MIRGERTREIGQIGAVAVVIGPNDDDHDETLRPPQCGRGQGLDERPPALGRCKV
jgi:hypothetical protein